MKLYGYQQLLANKDLSVDEVSEILKSSYDKDLPFKVENISVVKSDTHFRVYLDIEDERFDSINDEAYMTLTDDLLAANQACRAEGDVRLLNYAFPSFTDDEMVRKTWS